MQIGSCQFFKPDPWIEAANILTAADEPLMALKLLDMVPGYYRDNKVNELDDLKKQIIKMLATPAWYAQHLDRVSTPEEGKILVDSMFRGLMVKKEVHELNQKGLIPHIFELAPGEHWLPIGLAAQGYKFTYGCTSLNRGLEEALKDMINFKRDPLGPVIYCAFEIIEHLHFEKDIRVEIERAGLFPDFIHLSTPKYTFDGRHQSLDWKNKDLGHLRTYTPKEFVTVVMDMFPRYDFTLYPEQVMHLRGVKNGNKFL